MSGSSWEPPRLPSVLREPDLGVESSARPQGAHGAFRRGRLHWVGRARLPKSSGNEVSGSKRADGAGAYADFSSCCSREETTNWTCKPVVSRWNSSALRIAFQIFVFQVGLCESAADLEGDQILSLVTQGAGSETMKPKVDLLDFGGKKTQRQIPRETQRG